MQLSHRPHAGPAASAKPFTPGHPHTVSRSILKRSIRTYNHDATTIVKQPNTSSARADAEIVDEILQKIGNTDGGLTITADTRREVDDLLDELERRGLEQQPRPIQNPLLWGNYNVAYTSTSRATEQRGQPAGGRFRNGIGRSIFRTSGLFQSVLEPDVATNKVQFNLLGLLPGAVGLRGRVVPIGERGDTVKVVFEPPVLSLGSSVHLRIGPPSSVVLTTTYLDQRVRLGKGSRGSLFVFTRGGDADSAAMDQVGLQQTTSGGKLALSAFFAAMLLGGAAFWQTGLLPLRALSGIMWLLALGIGLVVRKGGMQAPDQEAVEAQQELQQLKEQDAQRQAEAAAAAAAAATAAGAAAGEQQQQQQQVPSAAA